MELLQALDVDLYRNLTSRRLVCWYDSVRFPFAKGICPIMADWLDWGEHGVIACLVYAYMNTEVLYGTSLVFPFGRAEAAAAHQVVYERVAVWLKERQFPKELVNCFDSLENKGRGT